MGKINWMKCLRLNLLTLLTVGGVISGVVIAIIMRQLRDDHWTEREVLYVQFLGDLFLRMLKALILPLIVASLISAIGSLDLSLSRKIGGRAIAYYVLTTVMAIVLGIILVTSIQPGVSIEQTTEVIPPVVSEQRNITTTDTLLDLVRNMFAPNLVQACFAQFQTVLVAPRDYFENDLSKWQITGKFVDGMNILGLVVASCAFGVAISSTRPHSDNLLKVFQELSQVIMRLTTWVIWLSPIGVLFLICAKLIELDNVEDIAGKLGMYFVTVSVGILFHGFVVLPTIYFLFTRNNPLRFISNMGSAIATAFGTSSSSATLPISIQCLEENNKTDPRVARFVLPIGATINMDGTALYEAVAAIFIAQVRGLSLSFGNIIAISITATAASIGAAGIPQAGLVTMVMVLDAIGLPAEDVSLILAVDWLLDRFRTVVNVLGDAFGAGIVEHLSQNELRHLDVGNTQSRNTGDIDGHPFSNSTTTIIDERM